MTDKSSGLAEDIADALDRRREAISEVLRIVGAHRGTVLIDRACEMAIPILYAHWEGFAKESLLLYVEYLEGQGYMQSDVALGILAYTWGPTFEKFKHTLTREKKVELIENLLGSLYQTLKFPPSTRKIDTKSNLKFEVFEGLAKDLCLDITPMLDKRKHLDSLVNRRNNIAHGGRPQKIDETDIVGYRDMVIDLMVTLETMLQSAVERALHRRQLVRGTPQPPPA